MEQRLIPIHLCPQCGSRYIYTFLDEECPDCNYKFEKEESMNMIAHCPICLGDELAIRIKPYWGEPSGDSLSDKLYETLRKSTQDSYTEIGVRHMVYKSLCNQFETIARYSIFELRCEQCEKELCKEGTNFVLLMKDVEELESGEMKEKGEETQELASAAKEEKKISRKGCGLLIMLCFITIISSGIISHIFG